VKYNPHQPLLHAAAGELEGVKREFEESLRHPADGQKRLQAESRIIKFAGHLEEIILLLKEKQRVIDALGSLRAAVEKHGRMFTLPACKAYRLAREEPRLRRRRIICG